jgi:hypothetical protein
MACLIGLRLVKERRHRVLVVLAVFAVAAAVWAELAVGLFG